jgi:hypothetical protein
MKSFFRGLEYISPEYGKIQPESLSLPTYEKCTGDVRNILSLTGQKGREK